MRSTVLARPRRSLSAAAVVLACAAAAVTAPASAAPPAPQAGAQSADPVYVLTDLGGLPGGTASLALGLSDRGVMVGTSRTGAASRPQLAVRWEPLRGPGSEPAITSLGTLPGSTFSRAFSVNNAGQAVGEAFTPSPETSRAILWEADGQVRDLGTLGGPSAVANDIDERGRAFGSSSQVSGPSVATVWDLRGPTALPGLDPAATTASRVNAASRRGVAVGAAPARVASGAFVGSAVRWTPRGEAFDPVALDRLHADQFATALGVNERSVAVGEASRLDPTASSPTRTSTRAVRWTGTRVEELPALRSFRFTRANDVSDRGEVVGFASGFAGFPTIDGAAVLWVGERAVDLNAAVLGGTGGFVLRSAEGINAQGQIVGFGTKDGQTRAFLLTPTTDHHPSSRAARAPGHGDRFDNRYH